MTANQVQEGAIVLVFHQELRLVRVQETIGCKLCIGEVPELEAPVDFLSIFLLVTFNAKQPHLILVDEARVVVGL